MAFIEFIMKTIFEIIGWFLGLIVKLVVGFLASFSKVLQASFLGNNGVTRKAIKE